MNHAADDRPISCPNCGKDSCLQFIPMLEGMVWGQCHCGFGWELEIEQPSLSQMVN